MKTKALLILALFLVIYSSNAENYEQSNSDVINSEIINNFRMLYIPYSNYNYVEMEIITTRGEYILLKCKSEFITNYPLSNITGKKYNYFVYKNNRFHLTVNDFNKNYVYQFFTNKI